MASNAAERLAAIDIGTNSVLLTVATVDQDGPHVIDQRATVTRLGQDVDRTRELHSDAIDRTLACLRDYRRVITELEVSRSHAVGTSALRDAQGGADFVLQAQAILGFTPEVISGVREAELTFSGALSGLPHQERAFVFDIGGGSTELIVGTTETIEQCTSLDIGSVRLTERHSPANPPSSRDVDAIRASIRQALADSHVHIPPGTPTIGVAGTVTTLAVIAEKMTSYDPAIIHGYSLDQCSVSETVDLLASMTIEQRKQIPGLTPGRADVIVAGSILCEEIMGFAGATRLTVSDRGVRFGVLGDLAARP